MVSLAESTTVPAHPLAGSTNTYPLPAAGSPATTVSPSIARERPRSVPFAGAAATSSADWCRSPAQPARGSVNASTAWGEDESAPANTVEPSGETTSERASSSLLTPGPGVSSATSCREPVHPPAGDANTKIAPWLTPPPPEVNGAAAKT